MDASALVSSVAFHLLGGELPSKVLSRQLPARMCLGNSEQSCESSATGAVTADEKSGLMFLREAVLSGSMVRAGGRLYIGDVMYHTAKSTSIIIFTRLHPFTRGDRELRKAFS